MDMEAVHRIVMLNGVSVVSEDTAQVCTSCSSTRELRYLPIQEQRSSSGGMLGRSDRKACFSRDNAQWNHGAQRVEHDAEPVNFGQSYGGVPTTHGASRGSDAKTHRLRVVRHAETHTHIDPASVDSANVLMDDVALSGINQQAAMDTMEAERTPVIACIPPTYMAAFPKST